MKHVDHPSMQESCISMFGKYFGNMRIRTLFKDQSIEHTIEQIPQRTRIDQGGTNNKTPAIIVLDDPAKIPGAENDCGKPEKGKYHLSPFPSKLPTPCHPLVLDKRQFKPAQSHYVGNITKGIIGLDPDLKGLIDNDDQQDNQYYIPQLQMVSLACKDSRKWQQEGYSW